MSIRTLFVSAFTCLFLASLVSAQSRGRLPTPRPSPPPRPDTSTKQPEPTTQQTEPSGDVETLKIDTNLVTVPVIASSRTGRYIADLTKEEFKIAEDGIQQEVAFFATVDAPFHVVLLIDTSASTREKLGQIQKAAIEFVHQLKDDDQVKVVSFDDAVRDLNDFTNDKTALRRVIEQTRSGEGTKVYDAVQLSLNQLRWLTGRKAVVIFTDGVDWHSDSATFDGTIHDLDEVGVIVYPIRFDTRADTERLLREQNAQTNGVQLPTSDVIRGTKRASTPTTFPSDEPSVVPDRQPTRSSLPSPDIFRRRTIPPMGSPTDPFPDTTDPRATSPVPGSRPTVPGGTTTSGTQLPPSTGPESRRNDSITSILDSLYLTGDSYLKGLADHSGGEMYRADTLASLPQVFAAIAAELRTQYTLGYYSTNRNHDGTYRKIQVKSTRKDIALRARPGYRAPAQ